MAQKPASDELKKGRKALDSENVEGGGVAESEREKEGAVNALFEASTSPALLIDTLGQVLFVNEAQARRLGKGVDALLGKCIFDFLPPDVAEARRARIEESIGSGKPVRFEEMLEGVCYDTVINPIFDAGGDVSRLGVFAHDITDLKRAEGALRASETRFRLMIEKNADGIIIVDKRGVVRFANPAAVALLDRPEDTLIGEMFGFPSVEGEVTEIQMMQRDGAMTMAEMHVVTLNWNGEDVYLASLRDISERKRAEEGLNRLATAVKQAAESIMITDEVGTIQYVNPAFERITGYTQDEVVGQTPRILKSGRHDEAFYREMWDTLKSLNVWTGHLINKKKDGALYNEEASISPIQNSDGKVINYVAVKRDVTEEIRLERRLRQAQKMEALGTLTGGIAHDFNNILSGIMGYTELADLDATEGTMVKDNLGEVLKATHRAKNLVKQILSFSRQSDGEKNPIEIRVIVKEALKLLKATLPPDIEIHEDLGREKTIIEADPTQIHQVLMNLVTNGVFALRGGNGILAISLREVDLDPISGSKQGDFPSGPCVRLSVSDTGHGMTPEVVERIFDPYFTTKGVGKGTGLGLALVHGIVKAHKGAITVYSEPGRGSTFNIYMPRIQTEVSEKPEEQKSLPNGHERILYVDDDPDIAKMSKQALQKLGYKVSSRTSAAAALKLFRADPTRFDIVITDLVMPHMSGEELAGEVSRIRPEIPILLCTGLGPAIKKPKNAGIKAYLLKPVVLKEMAHTLRKVLDEIAEKSIVH